jgi:hypothetical protein
MIGRPVFGRLHRIVRPRNRGRVQGRQLNDVFREEQIEHPFKRDAHLFFDIDGLAANYFPATSILATLL